MNEAAPKVGTTERVILGVGVLGLAAAVIGTRWGVFTPDTRPDLYQNPGGFLRSTVQAWVGGSTGMGQGNFNAGAAPVGAVVWVIRSLGASPWLAVRIWRLLILLLGAWGIRRYLEGLFGSRLSGQARLLATVFWVVNPYVIVSGSTTPILLPYALLPWTMLAFLRATREPTSWRWPALFGLGFFAQTGLNAGVVPFFQLLALPAHLIHARWVEGAPWRDLTRVVWRCGLGAFAVSLYWLLPSLLVSGTGAGIASGTESPLDVARTSSYAETGRLLGNWPLYGRAGDRLFLGDYTVYLTSPVVLLASFLVPLLVGLVMWRGRGRERLLVVGLIATALPVMVGLFPPDDPSPAGRLANNLFESFPALLAFRTTNKVGSVVVLAFTVALASGWRAWQARSARRPVPVRWSAAVGVVVLLALVSVPLWNGGLYPLGYNIPDSWEQATSDLDSQSDSDRVFVIPGGTGGNYRWGMRSPDDLFPSLLERPVAVRNTVVSREDPTANFLSGVDTALVLGAHGDGSLSTVARYLGASDVLVRNDLLIEEMSGPQPWTVVAQADDDPGLTEVEAYGRRGTNTVPDESGPSGRKVRSEDPLNASLNPLITYGVQEPQPPVTAAAASSQVLVVGDGEAVVPLAQHGIVDGTQPLQFLGDMDDADFAETVARGGRLVLTDTNRRRAWDVNRVSNTTSATLAAEDDVDAGAGATMTRWPDRPDDQSVSELTAAVHIGASDDSFGLHPFGRPSDAFDGDPSTAWLTGGFATAPGDRIWIDFEEARPVETITITPAATEPSAVRAVRIRLGDKQVIEAVTPGQATTVAIEPGEADRVEVVILDQSPGDNPVGIAEIAIDDVEVRNVTRVPETLSRLAEQADPSVQDALSALPLDAVFRRAQGSVLDPRDDEEWQLDRRFSLPDDRTFSFEATLSTLEVDPEVIAAVRDGQTPCLEVALLDGEWLEARVASTRAELAQGLVRLEGCRPLDLDAGEHELETVFGWRLDSVRLSSGPAAMASASPAPPVTVVDRSATSIDMEVAAGDGERFLRLGEAYDERWRLSVDGEDAGPPILVDGYSTGWLIDGEAHRLEARFAPQRAVQVTFVASAMALVGLTAVAVLPAPAHRRRRPDEDAAPASEGSDE